MGSRASLRPSFAVLAVAVALPSCSFLLDFDSLQGGKASAGAANNAGSPSNGGSTGNGGALQGGAPQAGAAGSISDAGAGGVIACECADTDTDPCTVARCIDRGKGPECVQEAIQGLALERDFDPIIAEHHYQLALVAGPSDFYLSTLSATGNAPNAVIYRFTASSSTVTPALDVGSLKTAGQPASLPAIAVDTSNGLRLHAFVALHDAIGAGAKVWRLTLDADLNVQGRLAVSNSYAIAPSLANQTQQPSAVTAGTESWGAWVNADGTIGVASSGLNPDTLSFGNVTQPASSIALLTTRGNRPAVLYTSDSATVPAGGVFIQSEGGSVTLSECQLNQGFYSAAYAAPTSFSGLWALGWTKTGGSFLTSEGTLALCPTNAPCAADPSCDKNEDQNLTRSPAVAAQHIQGDPAGVMYYVDVLPTLVPTSTTNYQASLSALLLKIDFGTSPNLSGVQAPVAVGDPLLITTQSTTAAAGYRGPDHAGAAIIADTAAIAWIEPTSDGNDRVRVQRYKMCLPP